MPMDLIMTSQPKKIDPVSAGVILRVKFEKILIFKF